MANWAIAIGIDRYDNLQPLNYAKRDAEAMRDWFLQEANFDEVFLFTEDSPSIPAKPAPIPTQPTFGRLQRFLDVQFEEPLLKAGDNLWFFFAGHGKRCADGDYLMMIDSNPKRVEATAISVNYVTERLRRCGADNVILFLDACRDEGDRGGLGIGTYEHQGVITFYSCSPNQKSYEIDEIQHGSFTKTLLDGLRISGEGNCATVERLEQYLRYGVPQLNRVHARPPQFPYAKAEPASKFHLILLPKYATIQDINALKKDALDAEVNDNWELAEQLWIRILNVRYDREAIDAIKRIDRKKGSSLVVPVTPTQPTGARSQRQENWFEFEVVKVNASGEIQKKEKQRVRYFTENLDGDIKLEMVLIPGDTFMMGAPETEAESGDDERPQHQVKIQPFSMGKYPVTQAQWQVVANLPKVNRDLDRDPSRFNGANRPVERVSWYDAVEFCDRLSRFTGKTYRLPSESEWEYACRSGTTTPFYFGETITPELANYNGNSTYGSGAKGINRGETTPVGSFPPNSFGLYDLYGNVWEWCTDHWHPNYEGAPDDGSIWLSSNGSSRLLRGGSWFDGSRCCRSAYRHYTGAVNRYNDIGFRVVCAAART